MICREHTDLAEEYFAVAEMLGNQATDQGLEGFSRFREHECLRGVVPIQFKAGGESGNPYLTDGSVGGQNKLGGWFIEADVEDAILLFHLKVGIGLGKDQGFLQRFQCAIRMPPEGDFIKHGASVPTFPLHRMYVE